MYSYEESLKIEEELLNQIKEYSSELLKLQEEINSVYEDLVYRFYHKSFKMFSLNVYSLKILTYLKMLMPSYELNSMFLEIVTKGLDLEFDRSMNSNWAEETNPVVYAFYQAKYMLDMLIKYGIHQDNYTEHGFLLPGWGSVLYLYNIR